MPHHAKSLTSASASSPGSTSVSVAAITAASVSPSDREAHLKPHKTPRKRAEKSATNPLPFFATLNPPLSSKHFPADSTATSAKHCAAPASPWHHHLSSNALAGAAAGALVSCCLHPVDTVKTVLQAEIGGNRRFVPAVTKILRERGNEYTPHVLMRHKHLTRIITLPHRHLLTYTDICSPIPTISPHTCHPPLFSCRCEWDVPRANR